MDAERINNKDRMSIKAGFWYTISNFITRALGFITVPLFTRLLTQEDFGAYSNFTTWATLLSVLCTLDLYSTVSMAKIDFEKDIFGYLSSISILGTIVSLICYVPVICFSDSFEQIFGMDVQYIHIMFIYLLVSPAFTILQTAYVQFMEYKPVVILTLSSSIISVLISATLVLFMDDKLFGRVIGTYGTSILFSLAVYIYIVYKGRKFDFKYCKYALVIALPLIPHVLSGSLLANTDRIFIRMYWGEVDLALYSLGYTISSIVNILKNALNQAWVPWFFANIKDKHVSKIENVSIYYYLLFICLSIGISLFAPEIVLIMGGKSYADAINIIPPVVSGMIISFAYTFYVNIEFYHKKTSSIALGTILSAIINIVLNAILVPALGYVSAAYTTTISYMFLCIFHYIIAKHVDPTKYYDNKKLFKMTLISNMIVFGMIFVYNYFYIRLALIVIYVCAMIFFIVKNKKIIKNILIR